MLRGWLTSGPCRSVPPSLPPPTWHLSPTHHLSPTTDQLFSGRERNKQGHEGAGHSGEEGGGEGREEAEQSGALVEGWNGGGDWGGARVKHPWGNQKLSAFTQNYRLVLNTPIDLRVLKTFFTTHTFHNYLAEGCQILSQCF